MVLSTIKCHLVLAVLLFVGGHASSRLVFVSSWSLLLLLCLIFCCRRRMNIYIRAQLCTSTAAVASKEGREFLGAKSEKISPSSASEVQTKIIIILNVNANKCFRRLSALKTFVMHLTPEKLSPRKSTAYA